MEKNQGKPEAMKRIPVYLFIILLLTLLTAFSQAGSVAKADCRHCTHEYSVLPECCTAGNPESESEEPDDSCQHAGLCSGDDSQPVVAAAAVFMEAGVVVRQQSFFRSDICKPRQISFAGGAPLPDLLPPLFLLNCSFLI